MSHHADERRPDHEAHRVASAAAHDGANHRREQPGVVHDAEVEHGEAEHRGGPGHALHSGEREGPNLAAKPGDHTHGYRDNHQGDEDRRHPEEYEGKKDSNRGDAEGGQHEMT